MPKLAPVARLRERAELTPAECVAVYGGSVGKWKRLFDGYAIGGRVENGRRLLYRESIEAYRARGARSARVPSRLTVDEALAGVDWREVSLESEVCSPEAANGEAGDGVPSREGR